MLARTTTQPLKQSCVKHPGSGLGHSKFLVARWEFEGSLGTLKHFLAQSISFLAYSSMTRRISSSAASCDFNLLFFVNVNGQFFCCQRNGEFCVSEFLLFLKNQRSNISNVKFLQRESGTDSSSSLNFMFEKDMANSLQANPKSPS